MISQLSSGGGRIELAKEHQIFQPSLGFFKIYSHKALLSILPDSLHDETSSFTTASLFSVPRVKASSSSGTSSAISHVTI